MLRRNALTKPIIQSLAKSIAALLALTAFAVVPAKADEPITLTVHHFLSTQAVTHSKMIVPWTERIEEASNGRLQFEVFPSMTLGGKPPELYGQVRDGVADIVWTLAGYTPGVFKRLEVFELPSVHRGNAVATNRAIQELFPLLAPDLTDVQPLLIHVHSGNALHMASASIKAKDDLAGLKIRSPSRTGAWMIESWGAEAVAMPVPTLPQALARNTIDGGLIPFEVAVPLKIADITDFSTELDEGDRFGTSVFMFLMNKDRFEGLPQDLQQIIIDNSGASFAEEMGALWDGQEPVGIRAAVDAGNTFHVLSEEASAEFETAHKTVVDRWIESVTSDGIDGADLVEKARSAIEKEMP